MQGLFLVVANFEKVEGAGFKGKITCGSDLCGNKRESQVILESKVTVA